MDDTSCKSVETGESFVNCIKEKAYSTEDIFTSPSEEDVFISTLNHSFTPKCSFSDEITGPYQFLEIRSGVIASKVYTDSLQIRLNPNITFYVVFTDSKLHFISTSPDTFPRTLITLKQSAGELWSQLKVLSQNWLAKTY